jgi:hypothetical protein
VTTLPPTEPRNSPERDKARQVAAGHWEFCNTLLNVAEGKFEAPLDTAVNSVYFSGDVLLEIDRYQQSAAALVSTVDPTIATPYQQYIFAYSMYRAALTKGATRHVTGFTGRAAADQLQLVLVDQLEDGKADWVAKVGQPRLREIAGELNDAELMVSAYAIQILAATQHTPRDTRDKYAHVHEAQLAAANIFETLRQARKEQAGNAAALKTLENWESLARSVFQS